MNNVIQMSKPELNSFIFNTQQVRTILIDGEPWFVLNDLCAVLGIANPSNVAERIDQLTLRKTEVENSRGQMRETTIVNEAGMYEVVIRANGDVARTFRRWITSEVLPAIRKTGTYTVAPATEHVLPRSFSEALRELATNVEAREAAEAKIAEQSLELETARPKAAQVDTYREAAGLETVSDLANRLQLWAASNAPDYKVLHQAVFDLAGELGVIIRGNTVRHNQPTAQAIKAGWVKVKETMVETNNHGNLLKTSARLTHRGSGRIWDEAVTRINAGAEIAASTKKVA